ncbi:MULTISPECIES: hypothetical protein [unclassified Pseudomonas]|uniref:hypothetical protein n=1 Tax=unclassified Pseudomonas TaxID=196821 RepID=UPI00129DD96B|nr:MULTISPECIES: hypothetical protein [unclassified Pseudomonas]MDH4653353.1 hypothetical protein [Pseudomonas sp. BN606]MRK20684.1 hypothetical protein [Pseudomonas sp. JG-B]
MQTMCSQIRIGGLLFFLALMLGLVNNAFADGGTSWVPKRQEVVHLAFTDGSSYDLKLFPDVDGVFLDGNKHEINGESYISVFQVSPSNPGSPTKYCGAGSEVWLYVYKVSGAELKVQTRVLVSSCLRSLSMDWLDGDVQQDNADFSAVQWNEEGFSIRWLYNVDNSERSISSTIYVLRNKVFSAQNILSEER